jgi:hypothetical protein
VKSDWKKLGDNYYHSKKEHNVKLNIRGTKLNYNKDRVIGFTNFFLLPIRDGFKVYRTATGAYEISSRKFDTKSEAIRYMKDYMEKHSY